ncbi:MAG: isoprenylcysteine carboxylmethyltransferase family protein [Asgard group archaeon]|nr:isoprenylcysteine carboxylmethyltransferase family protein [Asgard group archaeon]
MFEWLNLALMLLSLILFSVLYSISTLPVTLSQKIDEKAWKFCKNIRAIAIIFEFLILATIILWHWFPIIAINWKISINYWWIGLIIGGIIFIPGLSLMIKGMIDAGSESAVPSKETEMYGGIYNYIRHPQTLGEMPLFIALAFMLNSWFLVLIMTIYVLIYTPIMLYFEEKDLVKRFGEKYQTYQKETGMLLPKGKKFKKP